jgi:glucose-1-phosphate cytidylyltransferase
MKVVLFCGGQGIRLREYSESIPKPMIQIGYRPVLWHVMRYFAHFGHRDFILCLGYRADAIKDYFLRYNEALSNDFVLSDGGRNVELIRSDIQDWRISFVDTGLRTNVGQRLRAVRHLLDGEEMFLANYGDVLTDAPLDQRVERFRTEGKLASVLSVRPTTYTFHTVRFKDDRLVAGIDDLVSADLWINGGYFIFRHEVLDLIGPGEELIEEPLRRLIERDQLVADRHEGFWAPMDTIREVQMLEALYETGRPPWAVWQEEPPEEPPISAGASGV